jgi:hypothetical protein
MPLWPQGLGMYGIGIAGILNHFKHMGLKTTI